MVFPVSLPYPLSLVAVSSAISFRLPPASISAAASSGSPLTSLSIHRSLGLTFHGLSPLSVNFLTPAVFAFFRPLQFWVLTTQPLFLPFRSSHFRLTVASMLYPSAFAFRFSIFRSTWFPMLHFRFSVLSFPVCFLLPFPASLPQLFHRCFPDLSGFFRPLLFQVFSTSVPLSFVCFPSVSGYSAFLLSLSFSTRICLAAAVPVRSRSFRPVRFPLLFRLVSHPFFPVSLLRILSVSFRPSLFHSRSRSTGARLCSHSGVFPCFHILSSASALGF